MHRNKSIVFAALVAAGLMVAATAVSAATIVRITGDTVDTTVGHESELAPDGTGWWFNRDQNNTTPFEFNFDQQKIGFGSLHVLPIGTNPSDKFTAELFTFATIGETTSFSFDFLLGDESARAGDFYVSVYTNRPGTDVANFYECRFSYVATTGSTSEWTTVSTAGTPAQVTARGTGVTCPATLTAMPEGSTVRAFAINVGQSTAADVGTSGYLDNVVVTIDGATSIYDFEVPLALKDACKDGGHEWYGFSNQGACVRSLHANAMVGK